MTSVGVPDPLTRYRVRGRGVRVVRRGSEKQVATPDGTSSLPEGADGMLEWMLERDHFERGELAAGFSGVEDQTVRDVLATLSSVRVLEPL